MRSIMKKGIVLIALLLIVFSSLAACSKSDNDKGKNDSDTNKSNDVANENANQGASEEEPVTIEMWYHISTDQATLLLSMLDEFMDENPNIKVNTQSVAFAEIKKQLSIGVAADQLPDITLCDTVDNNSFAAMGAAVDITAEVEAWGEIDNYFEGPKDSANYQGKYYGVPFYSNCLAIMYNKDIFDSLNLDYPDSSWTWEEFADLVEKTTTADHYGLTMSLYKSEEGTFNVIPFIWQAGGDYDKLDSEGALEALTMINDFYQKGYMSKELISMTQADMCASLFATGKSAMMVAGSWLKTNIKNENPDLNYGVVTFANNENGASPIGGGNIMMMKDDNKDASWKLMEFLCRKENSLKFCEDAGYISPRTDAVEMSELWKNDPILSVYCEQLKIARARGPHPKWPEISSAIQYAVQDTLSGAKTPEQALKDAAATISDID